MNKRIVINGNKRKMRSLKWEIQYARFVSRLIREHMSLQAAFSSKLGQNLNINYNTQYHMSESDVDVTPFSHVHTLQNIIITAEP